MGWTAASGGGCRDRAVGIPGGWADLETVSWVRNHQLSTRNVDLLFVVDNSGSMIEEQMRLQAQFEELMETLREMRGGLPNVHIGITSTDLGTGMFQISYCEEVGGDQGRLLTGDCENPVGAPYIVDVEPTGCLIDKELDSQGRLLSCPTHECGPAHCDPLTTLHVDEQGCPRCRNYDDDPLEEVFSCIAHLGTSGCGFEQTLEAMHQALAPEDEANEGFLREHALLAVVLLTDEDDCSASNDQLYDNSQTSIDSTLGPLTSYRCFEFGVTCDVNNRTLMGPRDQCAPRQDGAALLHPISRYTSLLRRLKPQESLVVAAIAGPVVDDGVVVTLDEYNQPGLDYSCGDGQSSGAVPGIRLRAFVEDFNSSDDLSWAYTSICSSSFSDALRGVGEKIAVMLNWCPPAPLRGCADPGARAGEAADGLSCNDSCQPSCAVVDESEGGHTELPHCLEVCPGGPCPGNVEPAAAYAQGQPLRRDPDLPVEACWYAAHEARCVEARGAELRLSRRADPSLRTRTEIRCVVLSDTELQCYDGQDDDGDCLVDRADPDCTP